MACGSSLSVHSRPKNTLEFVQADVKVDKLTKSFRIFRELIRLLSSSSFDVSATGLELVAFLLLAFETLAIVRLFFEELPLVVVSSSPSSCRGLFKEADLVVAFSSAPGRNFDGLTNLIESFPLFFSEGSFFGEVFLMVVSSFLSTGRDLLGETRLRGDVVGDDTDAFERAETDEGDEGTDGFKEAEMAGEGGEAICDFGGAEASDGESGEGGEGEDTNGLEGAGTGDEGAEEADSFEAVETADEGVKDVGDFEGAETDEGGEETSVFGGGEIDAFD